MKRRGFFRSIALTAVAALTVRQPLAEAVGKWVTVDELRLPPGKIRFITTEEIGITIVANVEALQRVKFY